METTGRRKTATIVDVARQAAVSTATVSRVLNGNYPVAAGTRDRVLHAVDDLGYAANANARALVRAGSRTIGVVILEIVDPFFGYILRGVERATTSSNRVAMVASTGGDPERKIELLDRMTEQRADAVILVGGSHSDRSYQRRLADRARTLDRMGSVLVLCGHPPMPSTIPARCATYDNEGGAFAATEHLLAHGHRHIVHLAGPSGLSTSDDRVDGYRRALRARGVEPIRDLVRPGRYNRVSGYHRTQAMLAEGLHFTAVFAGNDGVAAGVYDALDEAGLSVPGDVSIVGYDDTPESTELRPRLTTVHVPLEEMGREAVRVATESADSYSRQQSGTVMLGTYLVPRDSVAAPRSG
ncbi:LacI family transcriptional regulator [Pseudonocardia sp. HH130630-07]|nr:LacI family transcriptional regulator [Pseudonocardia sp. HH130630-07]